MRILLLIYFLSIESIKHQKLTPLANQEAKLKGMTAPYAMITAILQDYACTFVAMWPSSYPLS